jgi:ribosomal protein L11 methyltransferase
MDSEPPKTASTWLAVLTTGEQSARRVAALVAESFSSDDVAVSFTEAGRGSWRVAIYFGTEPNRDAVQALVAAAAGAETAAGLSYERIAAADWVSASLAGLKPVAAGRFVVHGAHDRAGVPVNRIGIEIEAALAFGTGHHGTTRGCLLAIDLLCKSRPQPKKILDLGTGTGVLAIAAARAWRRRVLATDIDAAAVRVARENARLNRAGPTVEFVTAHGVTAPAIRDRAPFDLVLANILLGPLQRLAAPLVNIVAPGGHVVLSGLMNAQANAALAAYHALKLERRIEIDGWTTLVMKRPARAAVARATIRP